MIILCYSTPLRVELSDILELACNNFSNLFIQVNKSNLVCTNLTEIMLLYRVIEFSTTAAMQVLVLEYSEYTVISAFQAVQL